MNPLFPVSLFYLVWSLNPKLSLSHKGRYGAARAVGKKRCNPPFPRFKSPCLQGPPPSQAVLIFWQAVSERCLSARGRLSMTAAKPGPPISTVEDSKVPNKYVQVLKSTQVYLKASTFTDECQKYPQVLKCTNLTTWTRTRTGTIQVFTNVQGVF